jgi:hypothetical protein
MGVCDECYIKWGKTYVYVENLVWFVNDESDVK